MKVTEAKCLDSTSYFILPLIDPSLTANDFMVGTPLFVGTYTRNINIPWQDNHIFLLYKSNIDPTFNKLLVKLDDIPAYRGKTHIRLHGDWYILLTFVRPDQMGLEISKLTNHRPTELSYDTKVHIINFWNLPVTSNLHRRLFTFMIPPIKVDDTLGEQDLTLDKFELEAFEVTA